VIDVRLNDQPTPSGPSPPVPYVPPAPAPYVPPWPQPEPVPPPWPRPQPVAPPARRSKWLVPALIALNVLFVVVVLFALFWRATPRPGPNPPSPPAPTVDAATTGRQFVPILGSTYGDAWLAAADAMEQGKSVPEAQKILQDKWKDARTKEFLAKVKPVFEAVMPEGEDPGDPAKRKAIAELWRDFGRGLKGAR
jgi:hypothetical protein